MLSTIIIGLSIRKANMIKSWKREVLRISLPHATISASLPLDDGASKPDETYTTFERYSCLAYAVLWVR